MIASASQEEEEAALAASEDSGGAAVKLTPMPMLIALASVPSANLNPEPMRKHPGSQLGPILSPRTGSWESVWEKLVAVPEHLDVTPGPGPTQRPFLPQSATPAAPRVPPVPGKEYNSS